MSSSDLPENIGPEITSIQPAPGRSGFMDEAYQDHRASGSMEATVLTVRIPR